MKIADIRPLAGYCVLKEVRKDSLIATPDNAKAINRQYVVVAAHEHRVQDGIFLDSELRPGDIVRFANAQVQMTNLKTDDGELCICQMNDIAAVVGTMVVSEALRSTPDLESRLVMRG